MGKGDGSQYLTIQERSKILRQNEAALEQDRKDLELRVAEYERQKNLDKINTDMQLMRFQQLNEDIKDARKAILRNGVHKAFDQAATIFSGLPFWKRRNAEAINDLAFQLYAIQEQIIKDKYEDLLADTTVKNANPALLMDEMQQPREIIE